MPIYEYHCLSCDITHEIWQKITDQPKTHCPSCGGSLRKLLSMSSFSLKGGGWYADGYASVKPGLASTEGKTRETEKREGKATSNTTERSDTGAASLASPSVA